MPHGLTPTQRLAEAFLTTRHVTESLCDGLEPEDFVMQAAPEASPAKWHLAHTTWFFEQFVLRRWETNFSWYHAAYPDLFNSYYESVGPFFPRARRGLLSRPTARDVMAYRSNVSARVLRFLETRALDTPDPKNASADVVELGIHHEMQHQELLLTDVLRGFAANPLRPALFSAPRADESAPDAVPLRWLCFRGGTREVGFDVHEGFSFDNERPRHQIFLEDFEIASRPSTAGEFVEFIADGGYERPELWLSDGWLARQRESRAQPLYWEKESGVWHLMTLSGFQPLRENDPACHLNYFEADAFARWKGARLPTEAEWETVARGHEMAGNFLESKTYRPTAASGPMEGAAQLYGDIWEWTQSPYGAYPGFRKADGSLGEYNAKFMCNQFVLRGGSCVTPTSQIRVTYRNFFPPEASWQFSGVRLARDGSPRRGGSAITR